MHFPFTMALNGKTLVVASTSADRRDNFGRLVSINTDAIKTELAKEGHTSPLDFNQLVRTNVLIPQEVGEISFSKNNICFASRDNSRFIAMGLENGEPVCNEPMADIESCSHTKALTLPDNDPYAISVIKSNDVEEFVIASYESSDRLDVVKIKKGEGNDGAEIVSSFFALDLITMGTKPIKNQRMITRKIIVTSPEDNMSTVHFLFEQHPKKTIAPTRAKIAYLVSIKSSDILSGNPITSTMVEIRDLNDLFSISGVQDLYIDHENQSVILTRVPEAIFKINLTENKLIESKIVCTGATSMSVSHSKDMLVVPCFKDNRVASYSLSNLELLHVSNILGRGPAYTVIDELQDLIYVSFNLGGFVAILDAKNLKNLGHVFNKAPSYRTGS